MVSPLFSSVGGLASGGHVRTPETLVDLGKNALTSAANTLRFFGRTVPVVPMGGTGYLAASPMKGIVASQAMSKAIGTGKKSDWIAAITPTNQFTRYVTSAARDILATVARFGRLGGRFVPGLSQAIFLSDTVQLGHDFAMPTPAHTRIFSVVRAAGSGLAATNIPVLWQLGAGVAAIADLATDKEVQAAVGKWLGFK